MALPAERPDPLLPRLVRVRSRRRAAAGTWTLELEEQDGGPYRFDAGQFNMLTAFGVGEIAVSLSGDPAEPARLQHTVRAVGAVSRALAQLSAGAPLGLRGPFGRGWPLEAAAGRDVLVLAGGLGLAPLRPLLYRLREQRARYGRITLLYGTRAPQDVLYRAELPSWQRLADIRVHTTVDHAQASWRGHVGVVTTLLPHRLPDAAGTVAFVCGPELMMRVSIGALRTLGLPERSIYLSMERNMKCAVALCGRCQLGGLLVCRDGPVFAYDRVRALLARREL